MYCPHCGVANPEGSAICRICGKEMAPTKAYVICTSCGAKVPGTEPDCPKCGARLSRPRSTEPEPKPVPVAEEQAPVAVEEEAEVVYEPEATRERVLEEPDSSRGKWCPQCGRPKSIYADLCDYCAKSEMEQSMQYAAPEFDFRGPIGLPGVGGLFIVIGGFLGVIQGIVSLVDVADASLSLAITCFTGLMVVFGFIAVAGGISAMSKKNAMYAVLGGIFGILSVGFYAGAVLSVIGLVLIVKSFDEFEEKELSLSLPK